MIDPIVKTIEVPCTQQKAFDIFVDMQSWWPLEQRSMSTMRVGAPAKRVEVDARLGGEIQEVMANDETCLWGTFRVFDPHAHLQLDFHMGLPSDQTGQVDVHFRPLTATSTQVELVHSNWEGYGDMAEMMLKGYGGSWDLLFVDAYASACAA